MRNTILLLFLLCFLSNSAQRVFKSVLEQMPDGKAAKTVFLIGDAGEDELDQSGLAIMAPMLKQDPEASVIFLGDNIYPRGLHGKKHELHGQDEARIVAQMKPVKDHPGEVIFIPGNHDWEQGGKGGLKMIKRQQKFVEKYMGDDDSFMPDKGCPGPEIVELGDVTMIIIDTQWWLHRHKKSIGEADGCQVLDAAQFMVAFREALKKNRNKHVLVLGHHPLKSNGEHGGRFTVKDHLFPLTKINEKAYVPLPVLGSIYPLYRSMLGDIQDIQHPVNTEMVNSLLSAMAEYENVVYANGHEHNLQYFDEESNHLITSGSGSKVTHVGNSKDMTFGAERNGFARLSYFDSGDVWLEFFGATEKKEPELLFAKKLYQKNMVRIGRNETTEEIDYSGMTKKVVGDSAYYAGGLQKAIMGELNRELWLRPVEVPYLDIHKERGGLNPIKVGGGMQSKSIRFLGGDGHQYVVRQVKKNTTFLVSKSMRNTLAQDAVYDGIAGSHPYASIVVGALSDPLGIYHTNPELVFLPKDPILGDLQDEFGDSFCIFEERPNKDMSHESSFGNSKKVIGYGDMVERVHEKKKHRVDEGFTLRNRLFDMVIGDWDRHDDQWRWASFKEEEVTYYRPIPRDRDQAFFKFDGLLPNITNRKWLMRKFQKYGPEIRDIKGQNFNARYFDRSWLNGLDWGNWQEQVQFIKGNLSDEDIDDAIALFPDTAEVWNGDFLKFSLKARRDGLEEIAARYYSVLAKSVKVVGKNDEDLFEVKRMENGKVHVTVSPLKDGAAQKEYQYFDRVFDPAETKEIILYGLDGKDVYEITGSSKKGSILVRIVGGEEKDIVKDSSKAPGLSKKTKYYDDDDKNKVESSGELRTFTKKEKNAIQYDRKDFVYGTYMPIPFVGFNTDDGVLLGAGISWKSYGFNKSPYKSAQSAKGNYALKTGAFNLEYEGHFIDVMGPFDFGVEARANYPFIFQYNGAGNETTDQGLGLREVRLNQIELRPYLSLTNKTGSSSLQLNLHGNDYRFSEELNDNGIATTIVGTDDFFFGGGVKYTYDNVDNEVSPHRGFRFMGAIDRSRNVEEGDEDIDFTRLKGAMTMYFPLDWMPTQSTLALRTGAEHVDGDFNFYQAAFLGGQREFRGVARNRYAGNTTTFNNAELRVDLREFNNYTLPFRLGIMGHYDLARVWLEGEESDTWHNAYGGGVYFDILGFITLNTTYSVSDDGEALLIQGGFFF